MRSHGQEPVAFDDVKNEIFDMVKPSDPQRITLQDLLRWWVSLARNRFSDDAFRIHFQYDRWTGVTLEYDKLSSFLLNRFQTAIQSC